MTDTEPDPAPATAAGEKGAAVRFPPPALFVLLIALGAGLDYLWPAGLGIPESFEIVGIALCLFTVAVGILIGGTFRRAGTAIQPWKPTTRLLTSGFYRFSRNPIYVGVCLFNIGIGVATNTLWIVLSFIPGALLVYHIAIKQEEAYLEQKFGDEYRQYRQKVRRWL